MTYDEQLAQELCEDDLQFACKMLHSYKKAINRIDDYFEYRMESKRDQLRVREILDALNLKSSMITLKVTMPCS